MDILKCVPEPFCGHMVEKRELSFNVRFIDAERQIVQKFVVFFFTFPEGSLPAVFCSNIAGDSEDAQLAVNLQDAGGHHPDNSSAILILNGASKPVTLPFFKGLDQLFPCPLFSPISPFRPAGKSVRGYLFLHTPTWW